MYRDRGVYVFPAKDKMRIFAYDSENAVEYPPLTYAEQLVDFLEIDMTPFRKAERFEDKQSGEKRRKDLDYAEYSEWLTRLREVRERWKNGKVGDEEILNVIRELG